MRTELPAIFVVTEVTEQTGHRLRAFIEAGGKLIVLSPTLAQGAAPYQVPDDVTLIDLRYGNGVNLVRGRHPRIEGYWPQYSGLRTGLARNLVVSQTISNDTPIEDAHSRPHEAQLAPYGTPLSSEDYRHTHNHHQNLLVETFNFSPNLNAVSIWGDSAALVPGAKSWGAFVSARSWPLKWDTYTPAGSAEYDDADFDAQLVGIEIDVLNAGLDWGTKSPLLGSAMAKVGVQIVGFGNRNTAAVEIRTEDSDDATRGPQDRRGAWHWGIILRNALGDRSTVLMSENGRIRRGIDFDLTTFTEGALRIAGAGENSGIVFDNGTGGQIYSEPSPDGPTLCIRAGRGGLRILTADGTDHPAIAPVTPEAASPQPRPFDLRQWAAADLRVRTASPASLEAQERQRVFQSRLIGADDRLKAALRRMTATMSENMLGSRGGKPYFVHVPKCAGSTVNRILAINHAGLEGFVGSGDLAQFHGVKSKPPQEDYAYLSGHLPFGSAGYFTGEFVAFGTLRDPVQRLLSEYHYLVSAGESDFSVHLQAQDASLLHFLNDMQVWQINPSLKFISGAHPMETIDEWDALWQAFDNLIEKAWLFAPVDHLGMLLTLCARKFGWRYLSAQPQNVHSPRLPSISDVILKAASPYTFADQLLFEMVEAAWMGALTGLPASAWVAAAEFAESKDGIIDLSTTAGGCDPRYSRLAAFVQASR
ncbi:sulfotransferase family 2 domain-containing protein [Belnapia moabensis]|uniref:sulfotransferase family 2 domain-containing protein n=1 Tax=Belnapia moabensis TaxID=365533 RepID=UPI0005BD888D|nr:sulfotransferase family 2 domain-containing protein [Belnapia moabensis]